jgi:hypothetical protein
MARTRGMIEIRLDRRQAFYAVVGSLLIVSVVFVVGLIVGQRMQLIDGGGPSDPSAALDTAPPDPGRREAVASATPDSSPSYTFYDELRSDPPRPLLLPSQGGIGEPATAIRTLERQPPTTPSADSAEEGTAPASPRREPERAPAEERRPEPAPQPPAAPPEPERAPPTAPADSEHVALARRDAPVVAPIDAELAGAPRVTRRAVRHNDGGPGAAPQEFGYFTVEAGTFGDFSSATARRNQLREQGHDAIVTIIAPNDGPREYRVQIGSYRRRAEADDVASQVGRMGIRARVVQEG